MNQIGKKKFKLLFLVIAIALLSGFILAQEGEGSSEPIIFISNNWNFDVIQQDEDVRTNITIINSTTLELTLFALHDLPGAFKWDMAICNLSGFDGIQYMEEDAQGGFDNSIPINLNYGALVNFGMNTSWCGDTGGSGFILFSNTNQNQLPKHFRILFPDDSVQFSMFTGSGTEVIVGQSTNKISYISDWFSVNVTLFINESGDWNNTASDIWIVNNPDNDKFGADVSKTNDSYFKYLVESSNEIEQQSTNVYYISKSKQVWCGSVRCTNEERHLFDFSDICTSRHNNTIVNETTEEVDGGILFNPQCSYNLSGKNLEIEFWAEYNETLGMIRVDPSIQITNVATTSSILNNITAENNFTHLTASEFFQEDLNNDNYHDGFILPNHEVNDSLMSGVVLWMHLDNETGENQTFVRDWSRDENNGTVTGDAVPTSSGTIRRGYEFDGGTGYIDVLSIPDVLDGTMSVWFKMDGTGPPVGVLWVIATFYEEGESEEFSTHDKQIYICPNCQGSGTTSLSGRIFDGSVERVGGTTTVNDSAWHHGVITFNSSNFILYVDGIENDNEPIESTSFDFTNPALRIAGIPGVLGESESSRARFNGTLDEFIIWDRALSASEVSELYNRGVDNLVLYMPFDVNTSGTTYDYTTNDNDGTFNGDASWNVSGIIGGASTFDASGDYVEVPFDTSFNFSGTQPFTISAWFLRTSNPAGSEDIMIKGDNGDPSNINYRLYITSGNTVGFFWENDGGTNEDLDSGFNVQLMNIWHHTVGVWNGSNMSIYVDGVTRNSKIPTLNPPSDSDHSLTLGIILAGTSAQSNDFGGRIDEVMIFNIALTTSQVADLYNNQSSRFNPIGTQEFQAVSIEQTGAENRVNVTIDSGSTTDFSSTLEVRLGSATINNYSTSALPYVPEMWWRFDNLSSEGENDTFVKDFGSRSVNLTCSTCPEVITSSERFFNSRLFNDNQLDGSDSDIIGNITIVMWVNKTSDVFEGYVFKEDAGTTNGEWEFDLDIGERLRFNCGGSFDLSTGSVPNNEWSFVGVTFNEATNEIVWYINGVQDSVDTNTDTCLINDTESIHIGDTASQGGLDEVMIFERILTEAEINQIYMKGGFDYTYTDFKIIDETDNIKTFNITNVSGSPVGHVLPEFRFTAGNGTAAATPTFITSNLANNVVLDTFGVPVTAAPSGTAFNASVSQSVSANLQTGKQQGRSKDVTFSSIITSLINRLYSAFRDFTQTFSITSLVETIKGQLTSISQTFQLTSLVEKVQGRLTSISQNFQLNLITDRLYSAFRDFTQTFQLTTLVEIIQGRLTSISQTFSITALVETLKSKFTSISQNFQLTSIMDRIFGGIIDVSQTFSITSLIDKVQGRFVSLSQSFVITSLVNVLKTAGGGASAFIQNVVQTFQLNLITDKLYSAFRDFTQTFSITSLVNKIKGQLTSISQTFSITSFVSTTKGILISITQTLNIDAFISKTASFFISIFQSILMFFGLTPEEAPAAPSDPGGGGGSPSVSELDRLLVLFDREWPINEEITIEVLIFNSTNHTIDIDSLTADFGDILFELIRKDVGFYKIIVEPIDGNIGDEIEFIVTAEHRGQTIIEPNSFILIDESFTNKIIRKYIDPVFGFFKRLTKPLSEHPYISMIIILIILVLLVLMQHVVRSKVRLSKLESKSYW